MAEPALFSLGPKGVITEPNELLRQLFVHAWLADHSQSVLHKDTVFSIQKLAADWAHNPPEFATKLRSKFQLYLSRYFTEGAEVEVTEINPGVDIRYTLRIDIVVTKNGQRYSLGESLYRDNTQNITRLEGFMP